jgi:peptide/nickel transport system substrate-binding protein
LGGFGALRDAPLPAGTAGADADITRYAYDPAAAAALLDKAGYVIAPDTKIRTKTNNQKPTTKNQQPTPAADELAVTITTIDAAENRRAAEIVKEGWSALGIKTDIVTAAADSIQKSVIKPREYDALLFGEILGPDADPFPFWHSSQMTDGLNLAYYSNRRVDELLEKSQIAATSDERARLLAEFQQIITAETPAIFLYQPSYLYPQSSKIKNFIVHLITSPADRFANVTDWYRKLKLSFK